MIPAPSYDDILKFLNGGKLNSIPESIFSKIREAKTIGFIIFDQNYNRDVLKDLISNLDTLNIHSGTHMHFLLCGVSKFGQNDSNGKLLGKLNGVNLYHNAMAADSFVQVFEREIAGWSYGLGLDLILVDIADNENEKALDFSSAVFFKVEALIEAQIIERPTELVGKLVKFSREGKFTKASDFREELRRMFGINWLKALILAMFPKAVGKLARAEAALGGSAPLPR